MPSTNPAHALKILSSRGTPYDVAAFGGNDMYRLIRAKKLAQVDEKKRAQPG